MSFMRATNIQGDIGLGLWLSPNRQTGETKDPGPRPMVYKAGGSSTTPLWLIIYNCILIQLCSYYSDS